MTAALEEWDARLRSLFGLSLLQHPARLRDGLRAACKELSLDDDAALLARVDRGDHLAKTALARALTIGETYFFREPPHFALLREELLPSALARGEQPVVLVSAACSSGEEAYSMGIVARQVLGVAASSQVRILGMDVNETSLAAARRAVYRAWSLRGVTDEVRARWLEHAGDTWEVVPAVRSLVTFERRNLVDPNDALPPASADVIFCRNVLIYLDDEHVAMVLRRLSQALRPGGALVVSSAEAALFGIAGLGAHQRGDVWVHSPGAPRPAAISTAPPLGPPPSARVGAHPSAAAATRPTSSRAATREKRARSLTPAPSPAPRIEPSASLVERSSDDVTEVLVAGWASLAADPASASTAARRAILLDRTLAAAHVLAASAAVAQRDAVAARRSLRNARRYLSGVAPGQVMRGGDGATAAELQSYCARLERALEGRSR